MTRLVSCGLAAALLAELCVACATQVDKCVAAQLRVWDEAKVLASNSPFVVVVSPEQPKPSGMTRYSVTGPEGKKFVIDGPRLPSEPELGAFEAISDTRAVREAEARLFCARAETAR